MAKSPNTSIISNSIWNVSRIYPKCILNSSKNVSQMYPNCIPNVKNQKKVKTLNYSRFHFHVTSLFNASASSKATLKKAAIYQPDAHSCKRGSKDLLHTKNVPQWGLHFCHHHHHPSRKIDFVSALQWQKSRCNFLLSSPPFSLVQPSLSHVRKKRWNNSVKKGTSV